MKTRQKTLICTLGIISILTLSIVERQNRIRIRDENQALQHQVHQLSNLIAEAEVSETFSKERSNALSVPAPPIQAAPPPTESPSPQSNNVMDRIFRGYPCPPKVSAEQIEPYLKEAHRIAASLLKHFS